LAHPSNSLQRLLNLPANYRHIGISQMAKSAGFNWLKPLSGLLRNLSCTLAMAPSMTEPLPPLRFVEQADWAPFTPKAQGKTSEGLAYEHCR
jgi:hypothetical protein